MSLVFLWFSLAAAGVGSTYLLLEKDYFFASSSSEALCWDVLAVGSLCVEEVWVLPRWSSRSHGTYGNESPLQAEFALVPDEAV